MFARIVEFTVKAEMKEEFVNEVRTQVLPILKKQPGFLEILPLFPENKTEKVITITLWTEEYHVEKYEKEVYPKVEAIVKPYLITPVTFKHYLVETTLCEKFVETPGCLKQWLSRSSYRLLRLTDCWEGGIKNPGSSKSVYSRAWRKLYTRLSLRLRRPDSRRALRKQRKQLW